MVMFCLIYPGVCPALFLPPGYHLRAFIPFDLCFPFLCFCLLMCPPALFLPPSVSPFLYVFIVLYCDHYYVWILIWSRKAECVREGDACVHTYVYGYLDAYKYRSVVAVCAGPCLAGAAHTPRVPLLPSRSRRPQPVMTLMTRIAPFSSLLLVMLYLVSTRTFKRTPHTCFPVLPSSACVPLSHD